MTDRELLELAAKAAGKDIDPHRYDPDDGFAIRHTAIFWNPIDDDGDALRLAVKLKLSVKHGIDIFDESNAMSAYAYYGDVGECNFEPHGSDPYAATRRAIVRAAAEIGKGME